MTTPASTLDPTAPAQGRRAATFQPTTFNDADNSVEVVWTTGAAVARFDWYDGEVYDETLAVDAKSVRLDRLQAGGPVLVDHIGSTRALAGSIEPGSVRLIDGKGFARVRFTDAADMKDTVQKVREGHLRTVSVGYRVHTYKITRNESGGRDVMHATDWEPLEISLTPVPADPGAIIRSRSNNDVPEIIEDDTDAQERRSPRQSGKAITAEHIRRVCVQGDYSRSFERDLLEEHEDRPFTQAAFQRRINDEYSRMHALPMIDNAITKTHGSLDDPSEYRAAMIGALTAKISGHAAEGAATQFRQLSIVEMARMHLSRTGDRDAMQISADSVIARVMDPHRARVASWISRDISGGMHTTSDFSDLIGAATDAYLIERYRLQQSPLKQLARRRDRSNFLMQYGVQVSEFGGGLDQVAEGGEFKNRSLSTRKEGYALQTYGAMFTVSRQMLVNDHMGGLADVLDVMAAAAVETEATILASLINSNVPMADGKAWFHADHGNLAASGAAPSITTLDAGRQTMRQQKEQSGRLIDVQPKFMLVPVTMETAAEVLVASTIAPTTTSEVNPFAGKLVPIAEPRLTNPTAWYLFADPNFAPALQYSYLGGQDGPFVDSQQGWRVDGTEFKVRHDFGAGVLDEKLAWKNPGA